MTVNSEGFDRPIMAEQAVRYDFFSAFTYLGGSYRIHPGILVALNNNNNYSDSYLDAAAVEKVRGRRARNPTL